MSAVPVGDTVNSLTPDLPVPDRSATHLPAREPDGPVLAYDGGDIEFLHSVRIGVDVADHRAEFLYWGFYEPRPWRNFLHTHSFFEICYAYSGSGLFRTGEREYTVDSGTLFVARPGDVHEIISSTDDPLCLHFWSYTLIPAPVRTTQRHARPRLDPGPGTGLTAHDSEMTDHGRRLLETFASPATPVLSESAVRVPALLELLAREATQPGPAFGEIVNRLAGMLVIDTARAVVDDPTLIPSPEAALPARDEQVARTMVRYLQDNYDRPVAVRDVAAQVHLSERHAGRVFRAFTGTTVHGFLVRLRLEIAAQRLLERAVPKRPPSITEIARSCGYPDVRHFTTAFRRHWGVTPGVFRAGNGTAHVERGPDMRGDAPTPY
ncbi:AraC family transcriptional regulator [Actinopolymorpha sp. B17G11]|uniref:AraC family transcriptional regulator n=1 Tax=Actinopolymorpha sp. B17G11 TaxID=3160861 RepID=UPI0032E5077D